MRFAFALLMLIGLQISAAQEPIRIGAMYIFTGAAATYGEFAQNGIELAVDEINEAGGILGRPVEVVFEDTEGSVEVAIRAARRLAFQDNVDVMMGLDSSGVAAGVTPIIPELERPFIITHAATPDVTGALCNRFVFRSSVNINQNIHAAAELAAQNLDATRWTTIGPDYAFGRQSWDFFQQYAAETIPDVEFMDTVAFPPFGAQDFAPFITRIMDAEPEGVLISLWGGDLINFVRQADNLGFFDEDFDILMTLGGATEVLYALEDRMPENIWVGTRYWFAGNDSDINQNFVNAYRERYGNLPSYNAEGAYSTIYIFKAAIEQAGSTDADAIIEALSGLTVDTAAGTRFFRPEDHQAVLPATWGVTAANEDLPIRTLEPLVLFSGEQVTPDPAETGCTLGN